MLHETFHHTNLTLGDINHLGMTLRTTRRPTITGKVPDAKVLFAFHCSKTLTNLLCLYSLEILDCAYYQLNSKPIVVA